MADVEARVNDLVLADLAVHAEIMTQDEAVKSGAMALFGEKYGDEVRVISVGDWARELCGGTHADRSGQLGVIKLLGESSIGSGVRRVEALVGGDAYRFLAREHVLVAQLSEALKVRPEELPERVNDIVERLRAAEKEIEKVRVGQLLAAGGPARGRRRRRAAGSTSSRTVPTAPAAATYARSRSTCAAGCPQGQPGVVVIIGSARRQGRRSSPRSTTRPARRGVSANELVQAPSARSSGGRAAARTTSRRAAAPTPPGSTRRSPRGATEVARQVASIAVRPGVRLGIDPGDARIGVARSDPSGFLATPVETVRRGKGDLARIARILEEEGAVEVVVGLPRSLSGGEGPAAVKVREFAGRLARRVAPVPVRLCDERLTTVSAEAMLRDRGRKGSTATRGGRPGRGRRDPAARTGHRARIGGCAWRDRSRRPMTERAEASDRATYPPEGGRSPRAKRRRSLPGLPRRRSWRWRWSSAWLLRRRHLGRRVGLGPVRRARGLRRSRAPARSPSRCRRATASPPSAAT